MINTLQTINDDVTFIGPPSPASMEKLQALQNEYGWSISSSPG